MKAVIIRTNGNTEQHEITNKRKAIEEIRQKIGAPGALDSVNLRDGRVMFVDDTGAVDGKPVNPLATAMYKLVTRPGTQHQICGDVAIALDADFA